MSRLHWCILLLITAGFAVGAPLWADDEEAAEPVIVASVVEREVATGQMFVGTVMPIRTSVVGSAVDGRVIEFLVDEGDAVKKGGPLARLRTETLEIQLSSAQAELQLRREELAELKNGSRPEEIAQVRAGVAGATSRRDYAKSRYERLQSLFDRGGVTDDQLQESYSAVVQTEQAYLVSKAALDLAVLGPRVERIAQAEARVAVQREQVRLIQDQIARHTILAPFDGYVTAEHTEVGQWVERGASIVEVVQLDVVEIRASVLASHAAHLKRNTTARVEVPAMPNELFTGQVVRIVPQADVRSRTFPVKLRVENRPGKSGPLLKAGMLARVELPTGEPERMMLVSKDAVVLAGPEPVDYPVVYVVDAIAGRDSKAVVRAVPVELGVADGTLIQAKGNLRVNQQVVVRGNERLQTGQTVLPTGTLNTKETN